MRSLMFAIGKPSPAEPHPQPLPELVCFWRDGRCPVFHAGWVRDDTAIIQEHLDCLSTITRRALRLLRAISSLQSVAWSTRFLDYRKHHSPGRGTTWSRSAEC